MQERPFWRTFPALFSSGGLDFACRSSVIDDLTNAKHHREPLAYFYCDFRTRRSTTAVEVLRSILAQLITQLSNIDPDSEQLLPVLKEYQSSHPDPFYNPKGLAKRLSEHECKEAESLLDGLIISAGEVRVFATSRSLRSIASILSTLLSHAYQWIDGQANCRPTSG